MKLTPFCLLILLFATHFSFGQINNKIDSLILTNNTKPFSGVILIGDQKKAIYLKSFGYSNRPKQRKMQISDQFVVGSISKQFTAVIVLQEYEKGHIQLHVPICKYLPELKQSWADTVTIHHLLTHMHGITALDKPTSFKVGSQYAYSQIGYDILATITERTSGKSFAAQSAALFKRCKMKNTFHPDIKKYTHLTQGYTEQEDGTITFESASFEHYPAAGAFVSTAEDLLLWNNCFFTGQLLQPATMQLLTTKQPGAIRQHPLFGETFYGYGITVDTKEELLQWGQTGFAPGFVTMNFYYPATQTSVIVLENIAYDTNDSFNKAFKYHTGILDIVRHNLLWHL